MTDDLTRLATALGWTILGDRYISVTGKLEDEFDMKNPRDLDAFLKAAEAALTEEQRKVYGDELWQYAMKCHQHIAYTLATAPADVRLRALLAVVETAQ